MEEPVNTNHTFRGGKVLKYNSRNVSRKNRQITSEDEQTIMKIPKELIDKTMEHRYMSNIEIIECNVSNKELESFINQGPGETKKSESLFHSTIKDRERTVETSFKISIARLKDMQESLEKQINKPPPVKNVDLNLKYKYCKKETGMSPESEFIRHTSMPDAI